MQSILLRLNLNNIKAPQVIINREYIWQSDLFYLFLLR